MATANARKPLAFDTETALIRYALLAPPLVCMTLQIAGFEPRILHHTDAENFLTTRFLSGHVIFAGHNVAYDMGVIFERYPNLRVPIFDAYASDRVTCTKVRQQLLDIAGGVYRGRIGEKGRWIKHEYTLEACAKRMAGMALFKDGWRLSYGEFVDVPIADWPARAREVQVKARARLAELPRLEALTTKERSALPADVRAEIRNLQALVESDPEQCVRYPLDDARATLAVYQAQEVHAHELTDQYRQARAAFWLHLSSAWGLLTCPERVEELRRQTNGAYDVLEDEMKELGLVRENGTRDTKAAKRRMIDVCAREKLPLRRTDAHDTCDAGDACTEHVCLDMDACNVTGDPVLTSYAELSTLKKVLTNDIEMLARGTTYPVHTKYDLAETGRTTSANPPIQNLRALPGIRECFRPRPGRVFAQADFPQLELHTLAQCCVRWVGFSKLADALNAGLDPHLAMAATILGMSYEEALRRYDAGDAAVSDMRQLAKVANFGFPGGMGPQTLLFSTIKTLRRTNPDLLARLDLNIDRMKWLKGQWFSTWTEMPHYFARANAVCADGLGTVESLFTKRIRGGTTYCATCNTPFQGLGADCAKEAGWRLARAEYVDTSSPLYGARTVAFVHDEFILEVNDDDRAHDAAFELARLMREGANMYLPDVPIPRSKMKPLLMRRWSKKAKQVFNAEGRLIPWH
jgi:DNA polymerase I